MKSRVFIMALLFVTTSLFSQSSSINYRALIKDGNGNVVANQSVTIQFKILQGDGMFNVYQETHIPDTDANGIVIVNIGEGSVDSGIYEDIDWGVDDHYLNVQINTGSGLIDMGTTQFMAVPYALHAFNNSGLEPIDEGNGVGWRLTGMDPANFSDIGNSAIDLSIQTDADDSGGASGVFSIAMGQDAKATYDGDIAIGKNARATSGFSTSVGYDSGAGLRSVSFGYNSQSGGDGTAIGNNTQAGDFGATAIGYDASANEEYSIAIGYNSEAKDFGSIAIGPSAVANGVYATSIGRAQANSFGSTALGVGNVGFGDLWEWIPEDPILEVGIGGGSNALTILKNGKVGIGTHTPSVELDVIGSIQYTGTIADVSDERLKENIQDIENALIRVQKINGYSYNMINDKERTIEYGVIAQEVQNVFPEIVVVVDPDKGHLGVSYIQLIPILLEALKEQQEIIEHQNNKINTLAKEYSALKSLESRVEQLESLLNTNQQ
ncbi:tail fiber domain-containing protein [Xanthomarina spongicola]|uniref:Trimeric autotransporter adhesin n=1 Tax=Xanthomarina spongicola TaxID=570520 RepID=A0A316DKX8_9FLAO|nr:tail fiber domain-containing protein [Xanthomarina spongicola]PWK18565.1 trimeric autotransporter adhesin [Xanthomarina spongicola]